MSYQIFFAITLVFTLFSCAERKSSCTCEPNHKPTKIQIVQNININVDSIQYKHKYTSLITSNSNVFYIGLDKGRNALDIFDIQQQRYSHSLIFPDNGAPNSIQISDFYAHNADSIFLFSEMEYLLFLINIKGEVIEKRELRQQKLEELHQTHQIVGIESWNNRIYFDAKNQKIIFPVATPKLTHEKGYFDQKFLLVYDYLKNDFEGLTGAFPSIFSENFKTPLTDASRSYQIPTDEAHSVAILFTYAPEIVLLSLETKQAKYRPICSLYKKEFRSFSGDLTDIEQEKKFIFQNGCFLKPAYDASTQNYYFPIRHDQPLKDSNGKLNPPYKADWSVIKTDSHFNILGEAFFEGGKHDPFDIHAFDGKLLVLKENLTDENNEEDMLEFELYDF